MPEADESTGSGASRSARKAYGEFLVLQGTREEITLEELCGEHPAVAEELRALHQRFSAPASTETAGAVSAGEPERISLEGDSSISSTTLRRILEAGPSSERYVYKGEINRGGMGAIVKVWDEDLRRTLAMKVILGGKAKGSQAGSGEYDEARLTRFLEEAQITGQLDHPGVVPVHEVGMDSKGQVYFTMRLVRGRDLKEIFRLLHDGREGWNRTRALGVMLKVCEALAFAHEKGVIHRDLKPANIMVGRFGETYVMDWGLAKVLGREDAHDLRLRDVDLSLSMVRTDRDDSNRTPDSPLVTMDGDIVGTPCYMAPEQARGRLEEVGPASDVYSVGSMLYTLLTDRMPYVEPGDRMSPPTVLGLLLHGPPTPILELAADVPGELVAICEKAMAREPAQRYASTLEMAEDLRSYLEDRVVAAYEAGSMAEFRKWIARNKGMAVAIASAVVLALCGLGGIAWVQAEANEELLVLNKDIEDARDDALNANEDLGQANTALAAASERALVSERAALRNGYAANLSAADASLRALNTLEARQRLDRCPEDLRGWEWKRLNLEADSSLQALEISSHKVSKVAFSPDGRTLAAGTASTYTFGVLPPEGLSDRPVMLIDVRSKETLHTLSAHGGAITGLAFTPDGARLVSGSYDRSIAVWDARTGEQLQFLRNAGGFVTGLSISPDGRRLAVSILKKKAFVVDLDDISGPRLELVGHGSSVTAVAYSHDGQRIATGARDLTVRLWDAGTGDSLAVLRGHGEAITALAFDPHDSRLASASGSKAETLGGLFSDSSVTELFLWDLATGERTHQLEGHTQRVHSVAFSPDGRKLVSASDDGTLRSWDMVDGESEVQLGHTAPVHSAAFSPDGELVASGSYDGTVRLWDPRIALGVDLEGHQSAVAAISFWAEGTRLLSVSSDRTVRLWDPESGAALETWPTPLDGSEDALLAPIKRIADALLAPLARELALVGQEGGVVWSVDTGTTRLELEPFGGGLSAIWISPDASRLLVGAEDGTVRVLDGATGEVLHETEPLGTAIDDLLATPDAEHVFVVEDDQLYTWDVGTAVPERLFPEDTSDIATVIMSERGTRLAVSYRDGNVVILDAEGTELGRLAQQSARVNALAFNEEATRLAVATADRSVRLWDVDTREPLLILRRPSGTVLTLDFDAAGERLAAGYSSGRVYVWCTQPGNERHVARVQAERAQRMAHPVVSALFDELVEPALVVARLSSSSDLTADVEAAARSMARSVDGESQRLESECLAALRSADEQPAVYERALWLARLCVQRAPDDERYLRLQGMALARLGRYAEALPVLERAQAERTRNRRARPEVLAFLALCQHHLGRAEDAAQTLVQLRALMQISTVMGTEHALEFMREVEALLAPGR